VIQMGKLAVEEENRTLRDQNFEVQSRARAADAQLKKVRQPLTIKLLLSSRKDLPVLVRHAR
jgi:hypothetical protein